MSALYSPVTLDHFHNPRCVGEIEGPSGQARRENPVCGDVAEFWVRAEEGRVLEVRFRAFGCVATLAACSLLAESVQGRPAEQAWDFGAAELEGALGGLPPSKSHGAALAVEAFRAALGGGARST